MIVKRTLQPNGLLTEYFYSEEDYDEFDRINELLGSGYKLSRPDYKKYFEKK